MGSVKIDIYRSDRKYYHTSLSNEDDVQDIINTLDSIVHDANSGNYEALITLIDFSSLLNKNKVMVEYFRILTGKDGYKPNKDGGSDDYGKSIIELVSERLGLAKEECEEMFNNSIKSIVENNLELWLEWVNKNFKGKCKVKNKGKYLYNWDDDSSFYQLDFNRKYVVDSKMYKELGFPKDLQELIDVQKKNKNIIAELEQLKKDRVINKEQKKQLKKRNKFDIDLSKDIIILKQHYNIEIKNTNTKGKKEFISYSEEYTDKYSNKDLEFAEKNIFDSIIDDLQIKKIKEVANKILTDKQLVIFNLYYISEMTQQEIANLLDLKQHTIAEYLSRTVEKIKSNL